MNTENNKASAGGQIRKYREMRGLSQTQLAIQAGVSQTTISEIESGKSKDIGAKTLFRISDLFCVDPRHLLFSDAEMPQHRSSYHDEESLLLLYRKLPSEQKHLIKSFMRSMIESNALGKCETNNSEGSG